MLTSSKRVAILQLRSLEVFIVTSVSTNSKPEAKNVVPYPQRHNRFRKAYAKVDGLISKRLDMNEFLKGITVQGQDGKHG